MSRQWNVEVWSVVQLAYDRLKKKPAAGQAAEQAKAYEKATLDALRKDGECRHRFFNLAWLDPTLLSIPNDVLSVAKAERSGRYHFWDSVNNVPKAPKTWPQSKNIHVKVLQLNLEGVRQYGQDALICGFWWAYAQSIQLSNLHEAAGQTAGDNAGQTAEIKKEDADRVRAFETLCCAALVDWKLFSTQTEVETASFQLIENTEEERENNGFTGCRKILLVSWAHDTLKRQIAKAKQIGHEEVKYWL